MIVFFIISLIIGGLGFVQYKSDILFNVGFSKQEYDSKIVSKIVGLHVMIFALFLFILPIIFYQLKDFKNSQTIGALVSIIFVVLMILSINIQLNRKAKLSPKAIKKQ